jgi:hypothetical protein
MSEAGFGGLEDLQDFLSVQRNPDADKMSEAGLGGWGD